MVCPGCCFQTHHISNSLHPERRDGAAGCAGDQGGVDLFLFILFTALAVTTTANVIIYCIFHLFHYILGKKQVEDFV